MAKSVDHAVVNSYINGERWLDWTESIELSFRTGATARVPILDLSAIGRLFRPSPLLDINLDEIISFLYNVGQNWKRRDYIRRVAYERNLVRYSGYSDRAARNEADWIAMLLSSGFRMIDLLTSDLGDRHIVDDWTRRDEAHVRAFPRGTVLHLIAGNVPLSSLVSLLRALITKNASIIKLSSYDPFTATAIIQSFIDVDPDHPVSRSTSVVYWPKSLADKIGSTVAVKADALVAWGGNDAISWARQHARIDAEVSLFGPKRSIACIGPQADTYEAARAVAIDVTLYEQRACFSARQIFVDRKIETAFIADLKNALSFVEGLLPSSTFSFDEAAARSLAWAHADFSGDLVSSENDECGWAIIRNGATSPGDHPMGRTVVITPYDEIDEIYDFVDESVQTVAVYPWELNQTIRDECAKRGVSRIVESGLSNVFRVGGSHDGFYPLQRLVRIVTVDLPSKNRVKGIYVPINQAEFLEHDRFLEFVS